MFQQTFRMQTNAMRPARKRAKKLDALWRKLLMRCAGIIMLAVLAGIAGIAIVPAQTHAANPAQATAGQTILSELALNDSWQLGGGFIYWYEGCFRPSNPTHAFLNRRAVNGTIIQTLVDIDDADACQTLLGPAADDSGFYYYNRSDGTIEAIYTHTPNDPPTVLATVGQRPAIGFGSGISAIFLGEEHAYWIEVDLRGEFVPDEIHVRRVSKSGGDPVTLLTYEGFFAGRSMAITDEWILWTDGNGLQGLSKASCPGACNKTVIHEAELRQGQIYLNDIDEIFWWSANTFAGVDTEIFYTRCPPAAACQTQLRHTVPDSTDVFALVANQAHIFWTERTFGVGNRLRRLPIIGSNTPATILEDDPDYQDLAIDDQGVYYRSSYDERRHILRLSLNAAAIQREISFGGWEVTQAIQNVQSNDVPLIAGRQTFVRVYGTLDSGADSAGVEAVLHGSRNGDPLPGSPLRPLNGTVAVESGITLASQRTNDDQGWLFQLPIEWTKATDAAIPLDDATLTLRAVLDPRGLTSDTTPGNNSAEQTFTFNAKAPTCVNLRPVWTEARYQSPWDISVASVIELSESVHPTPRFLAFPEYNRLSEAKWCWKGPVYGPFCSSPYELDDDDSKLLTKMGVLDFFHNSPSICFDTGARTLYAGIVSAEASWSWAGLARRGKDQSLSKVPRYGTWSWPLTRQSGLGMTFVHEVGHNYSRRHIDCGNPKNPDSNFPYATDTLDDGSEELASTHFGFDTRLLQPIPPATNRDYMSYCGPRWITDYTWRAIFNNTRDAGPPFTPFGATTAQDEPPADAYVLVSGLITPTLSAGTLSPIWTYPTDAASPGLIQKWQAEVADPWSDQPYHVRVLDSNGEILTDRAIVLFEVEDRDEPEDAPFHVIFPEPDAPVHTIQLMENETVLDSYTVGAATPEVTILAPQGGETVENTFTLQWTATDPDNAPWLVYTVQYSPDLGETWYSLVVEQPGPGQEIVESLLLDLRGQPGSDGPTALLRVLASDGYNTGVATSEPFSVAPRAPDVIITAPEEGQWFDAGTPIQLRGDAFDPEDGVLNDDAYRWNLAGLEFTGRQNTAAGLAPGTYTANLQATDSDGQQGSAETDFHIAPLNLPLAPDMALDGNCDDMGYGALSLPLSPYAGGEVAYAALARTDDYLWVCLQGLQEDGEYAGIQIDVDNSQESTVQAGDLGFFVRMDGTLVALEGDEGSFTPVIPAGMAAHINSNGSTWSAELRIQADTLGGWNRRVALGIGHYLDAGEAAVWPHAATRENPQSWAQTNLGEGEVPSITELSPISTTVGVSVTLTITGTGFAEDTVVLWEDEALPTIFVDENLLRASIDGSRIDTAGLYHVQVAPDGALLLASAPRAFLVLNAPPVIDNLSPGSAPMEGDSFTLIVEGSGFVQGATVLWDGEARATSFISSTRLEAEIRAEDLTTARPVPVTVANPDPVEEIAVAARFDVVREDLPDDIDLYLPMIRHD